MMLRNLRIKTFEHIHRLPMANHESTRRGELTSRVTSDIETIARFVQYGAVAWIIDSVVVIGTLIVMSFYAWQLAVITVLAALPVLPLFRLMQRRQLKAYSIVRNRVGMGCSADRVLVSTTPSRRSSSRR
jgi:ABC-type bacteriocin/lantibiotic exporter with double-glycine peptidase domain